VKELLTEFLSDLLEARVKAVKVDDGEERVVYFGSQKAAQDAITAGTHRPYLPQDKNLPGSQTGTKKPNKQPREIEPTTVLGTTKKPAQAAKITSAPGGSSKIPDLQTTVSRVGQEQVDNINGIISRSLSSGKSDVIGGDGDQKRRVLSGELKVPGQGATATGPVHEVTVGIALDIIMKNPDVADEDISRLIEDQLKETKLGSSLGKRLYETVLKAVKSARAEATRLKLGIQKNGMNPETTVSDHYHGNEESKSRLVTDILQLSRDGYTIVTSDGNEIAREDIPGLIKSAGSSAHGDLVTPGDTFVVSVDPETKKVVLGTSSNKTARGDQSLNTTVLKELQDYRASLQSLIDGQHLSAEELAKVENQLKETDSVISKLSSEISSAFIAPVSRLEDDTVRSEFIAYVTEASTDGSRKNLPGYFEKFTQPYITFDPSKRKLSKKEQKIRNNLEAVGWRDGDEITQDIATKAWLHDIRSRLEDDDETTGITGDEAKLIDRFFQSRQDGKVDTSAIRMRALKALQDRHTALSQVQCDIDGVTLPVSQVVLGIFAARALHLEESLEGIPGTGKVYTKYRCYFKAVTGDIVGYPEANQAAIGSSRFVDFCQTLEISEPRIARKKGSEDDAGTITFDILSVSQEGQKRSICARVVRTKGGTALSIVAIPLKGFTDIVAANQPKVE
jgi:hypothetical protein